MSVFSASMNHRSFLWQISAVCFVLGMVLAASAFTVTQFARNGVRSNNPALSYGSGTQVAAEKAQQSEGEINKLRERNTELENKLGKGTDAASTLNKELQETKVIAGLTEVSGPGVQITLNDNAKESLTQNEPVNLGNYIHDIDIANVVNELKVSGAEAIAVNGQRISAQTAIRCVGSVVHINFVPAAPPYIIQAIGSTDALYGGMNLPQGVLDEIRKVNPSMVRIDKKSKLVLPAYSGSTLMHFAQPPKSALPEKRSIQESEKDAQK